MLKKMLVTIAETFAHQLIQRKYTMRIPIVHAYPWNPLEMSTRAHQAPIIHNTLEALVSGKRDEMKMTWNNLST